MITLIGTNKQYQLESVWEKLLAKGHDAVLIDFMNESQIVVRERDGKISVECDGRSLDDCKVVYHDPKYLGEQFGDTEEWASDYIVRQGWKDANYNIFELLCGKKLNPMSVILPLSNAKLQQLRAAADVGFDIPPFAMTNAKEELLRFASEYTSVITKSVGNPHIPEIGDSVGQRAVMTSPVSSTMIEATNGNQPFPILLQKNIKKKFEYRVVVAGTDIRAFRIDPNQHPIMEQDYRRGGYMVTYSLVSLDPTHVTRLMKLHRNLNLFSGSYDFIEGTDGRFYFLEVNPAGVWAWIDQENGGVVSDMFADEISKIYGSCT